MDKNNMKSTQKGYSIIMLLGIISAITSIGMIILGFIMFYDMF